MVRAIGRLEGVMPYVVTLAELLEIVPDLRAMASVEVSDEVRAALNRLADRYAAMAGSKHPEGGNAICERAG